MLAKGGNGLDMGGLTYWNPEMDGNVNVKWDSKFLTCITTVYGVANWSPNDISVPLISTPFASFWNTRDKLHYYYHSDQSVNPMSKIDVLFPRAGKSIIYQSKINLYEKIRLFIKISYYPAINDSNFHNFSLAPKRNGLFSLPPRHL